MPFVLRKAETAAEYAEFKALMTEYVANDHADPASSTIGSDIANVPGRYAPPAGGVVLADMGDALAGCAGFAATTTDGLAEMKRVFVRAQYRRQGLARMLALAVMDEARRADYTRIGINTWDHNAQAIALYAQLGFARCAPFKQHPMRNLIFMDRAL